MMLNLEANSDGSAETEKVRCLHAQYTTWVDEIKIQLKAFLALLLIFVSFLH